MLLAFTVYGVAAPKGSAKAFMRPGMRFPVVTHDNPRTKPWQESVVSAALEAMSGAAPHEGPVGVVLSFYLPRPASLPKRVTRPIRSRGSDLDKLERCVLDALTRAGVYRDDAQVVATMCSKEFAGGPDDPMGARGIPRVDVQVAQLDVDPWPAAKAQAFLDGIRPLHT
jgi:crossover junction endodeoxyribonuclease RusA